MEIVKVVVVEFPVECGECMFCDFERDDINRHAIGLLCTATGKALDNDDDYKNGKDAPYTERPLWCPLVMKSEE